VQIVFSLSNVQLSLFTDPVQQTSTLDSLIKALASAAGVSSSAVSVRRVRDVSNPSLPKTIWTNPQFAGDVFPARRRLSALGSVALDSQITLNSNTAASSMTSSLSSASSKLAADVKASLVDQGSPLSSSTIAAAVQPYPGSTNAGSGSKDLFSTLMSTSNLNVAVSITIAVLSLSCLMASYYHCRLCVNKRRYRKRVAPSSEVDEGNNDNVDDDKDQDEVIDNKDNISDTNVVSDNKDELKENNDAVNKSNVDDDNNNNQNTTFSIEKTSESSEMLSPDPETPTDQERSSH
jgi:hypothetical protein